MLCQHDVNFAGTWVRVIMATNGTHAGHELKTSIQGVIPNAYLHVTMGYIKFDKTIMFPLHVMRKY